MKRSLKKYDNGGKTKRPVFPGKLDNRVVSDNTSVQKPTIQKQDVRLKTPQEVKKANRENFQKRIGVKPTYNVQELTDFGTPEPGIEYVPVEAALLPGTPAIKGLGTVGNFALDMLNPLSGARSLKPKVSNKFMPPLVSNSVKNLEDLEAAKNFAQQYGYNLPNNLERISQSDMLTDRTVRGLMDRHNTFVRGVSTNWDEIEKRNPEILRHLEGKGIDWQNNPKAAAEYMSTHVPIKTGYGRASLDNEVFKRGEDAIYTSNSVPTAEGYTYGQGYITKVKKPTDFSSINRQDWINKNNPAYTDEDLFRGSTPQFKTNEVETFTNAVFGKDSKIPSTDIEARLQSVKKRIETAKKQFDLSDPNDVEYLKQMEDDYEQVVKNSNELGKSKYDNKLLRTERAGPINYNNPFSFNSKLNEFIKSKGKDVMSSTKGTPEGEKLLQDIVDLQRKNLTDNKPILNYLEQNHPDFFEPNRYAHYLHLGTPGEKILEPIKSWEITPDIWKNKSRAHTNRYTNKLSALEKGGVIKDNRGQWAHPGEITEIGSNNITMQGVNYPVLGVSDQGDTQMMYPEQNYQFKGNKVTEYPMMQRGGKVKPIVVNDPNDPRLQAYNDSLSLYNKGKSYLNQPYSNNLYDYTQNLLKFGYSKKIAPGESKKGISDLMIPQYKKPVQPYVYNPITKQTTTAEQIKPLYQAPQLTMPERLELSMNKPNVVQSAEGPTFKQGRKFMRETGLRPGYYEEGGTLQENTNMEYGKGGYTVKRSSDRKGKTHVVIGPDGTKKYFGDPNLGERGKSKYGKEAFYARHKKNLDANPYFRAYARATWEDGGTIPEQGHISMNKRSLFKYGGLTVTDLNKYDDGGVANKGTNAAVGALSTVANAVPGAGLVVPILDIMGKATSDEYGAPKSGLKGTANRVNPLSNLGRVMEGKDVGRSLLGLTGVGTIAEATGLSKAIFGKSDYDIEAEERDFSKKNQELYTKMNTSQNFGNSNVNTSNNMMFAKGGMLLNQDDPNANAELELQETFQMPDGTVGNVDGPSHENGGIAVDLPEGTRIWSDKLKYNGKTFAKHTKPITNTIAKLEKQIEKNPVNSDAKENSIALLKNQLDYYFDTQETNKQNTEMKRTLREGGMIKRADGSYSKRGLWDNIRANKGSGKKPTPEMLKQERKINNEMAMGGYISEYQTGGTTPKPKPKPKPQLPQTNYGFEKYYNRSDLFEKDSIDYSNLDDFKQYLLMNTGTPKLPEAKIYSDSSDWYNDEVNKILRNNPNAFKDPILAPTLRNYEERGYQNTMKNNSLQMPYNSAFNKLPLGAKYRMILGKPMPEIQQHKYGGINNPGFNALPEEVQENILAHMSMGGRLMNDPMFAEGGIHIKPENRGKFTAYAESHGKGVQEMAAHIMANKEDYSPAVVKRANFAKNAAGWKHEMGGMVEYQRGGRRLNLETPTNNMEQRWIKPEDNTPQSVNSFEYPVEPDFDMNNISEELYGNYGQVLPKQSMVTTRAMNQTMGTPPTMPPVQKATGRYGEFVTPQIPNPYANKPFDQLPIGVNKPSNFSLSKFGANANQYTSPENLTMGNVGKAVTDYGAMYENDPNIPKGQPLGSTAGAGMDNLGFTPEPQGFFNKAGQFIQNNPGLVGQLGTAALTAGSQMNRVNNLARPRTLADVRLRDSVANPNLVDYSAERNAIDRAALTGMGEAQRGFGSSAAAQAFKNKARLNQLEGTGRSFQGQENANAQIKNQFLAARQEAAMKEAMMNSEIGKYNLENVYGYDTMTTAQKNAITAMLGNTAGQTFGKQTDYANQLEKANILSNQYDPSVLNDMIKNGKLKVVDGKIVKARNGGTIKKRSFKK
jgi:hypothetical protein